MILVTQDIASWQGAQSALSILVSQSTINLLLGCVIGLLCGVGSILVYRRFVPHESPLQSWYYLVLALSGGILGVVVGWRASSVAALASTLLITALLGIVSLVDWRTRRIPNALNLALLAWALVQITWLGQPTIASAGLGLLVSGGLFLLLAIIGRGAMGLGDVKLAGVLGALLGFPLVLRALVVGIFAGGAVALYLLLSRRAKGKSTMAYGPYLAMGGWITALGMLLSLWR